MSEIELQNEALKTSPVVGVNVLAFCGIPLQDWVYIVTILYVFMQMGWLGYKFYLAIKQHERKREGK